MFRLNRSPRAFTRHPDSRDVNASGHYESPTLGSFKVFGMSLRALASRSSERSTAASWNRPTRTTWRLRWDSSAGGWRASATLAVTRYRRPPLPARSTSSRPTGAHDVSRITRVGTPTGAGHVTSSREVRRTRASTSAALERSTTGTGAYAEFEGVRECLYLQPAASDSTADGPRLSRSSGPANARLRVAWGVYHQARRQLLSSWEGDPGPMRAYHWVAQLGITTRSRVLQALSQSAARVRRPRPRGTPSRRPTEGAGGACQSGCTASMDIPWRRLRHPGNRHMGAPRDTPWPARRSRSNDRSVNAAASWRAADVRSRLSWPRGIRDTYRGNINSDRAPRYEPRLQHSDAVRSHSVRRGHERAGPAQRAGYAYSSDYAEPGPPRCRARCTSE